MRNPTPSLTHRGRTIHGLFAMTRGQMLRALLAARAAGATSTANRLERRLAEQRAYYDALGDAA